MGWDIYLLARTRGDSNEYAFKLAMQDTLRVRENVPRDLVARSVRARELGTMGKWWLTRIL
jgi:hypothetical protein